MREYAVESHSAVFIGIKSLVEKVAKEAAVLRDAFAVNAVCRSNGIGGMLRVRREVANGGETSTGHHRIGDHVDILVDAPGLKASIEMNVRSEEHTSELQSL